jgi:hypothetical protein
MIHYHPMTDLPDDIINEAERLTRHARDTTSEDEADAARRQRDELLANHAFLAREREKDATLVLYPNDWVADGNVEVEQIEDTDRAIERPLEAPAHEANWEAIETHNREIVERITEQYGDVHGKNAAAFADFMGNHYAKPMEEATRTMREEFLTEYFPRNAWPSKKQRVVVEQSIEITLETARARE